MIPLKQLLVLEYSTRSNLKPLTYDPPHSPQGTVDQVGNTTVCGYQGFSPPQKTLQVHSPLCLSIINKAI